MPKAFTIAEARDVDFADLIAGNPPEIAPQSAGIEVAPTAALEMLRALAARIRPDFAPAAWLVVEDSCVVGLCSLVLEPKDGTITIGYGIAPQCWSKGVATRAVGKLLEWARNDPRVLVVAAETSTGNIGSQRVLERNGFLRTGSRIDEEDGPLICWRIQTG